MAGIFTDFDSDSDSEIDAAINCMEQERPGSLSSSLYAIPPVVIPGNNKPDLNMQVQHHPEAQWPMCFLMFSMQHIQQYADNCSPWAMESEQSADLSECGLLLLL